MIGALCVVSAALVAIIAVYSVRSRRRHRDRMRQWADRHGWTFTSHPDVDWGRWLPGGNRHGVGDMLSSVLHGRPVSVAEYSVTDASDGTTTNTHYHVVIVTALARSLPSTQLEARGGVSRLKSRLVGPGDCATGNADFDRAFRLRSSEPAAVPQWFSAPLIAAHLSGRVPVPWSVQGNQLLYHRPGRLDPNEIPGHAAAILPLATMLDGHGGP